MGVVEGVEDVQEGNNFGDPGRDYVTGKGDVPNGGPEKLEAAVGCARDAAVERVEDVGVVGGADVNERFLGVQMKTDLGAFLFQ